ncbi:MAG: DNA/RNA nuclease SfsA, partial [Bacillota bacterium]|nr:DNA/RNA nuclease SfsA [Bacillota bacterium]
AVVRTEEQGEFKVHVPNTGRCGEIFLPHTPVLLTKAANPKRKYPYSLYGAYKGDTLIQIDSAAANKLAAEALSTGIIGELAQAENVQREKPFGTSRFDFRFQLGDKLCYMEVKGVTLEIDGVAKFPDAPTERGVRHLRELIQAAAEGLGAYVLFVVQMSGTDYFTPNEERDPAFAAALRDAAHSGVTVLAYDAVVTPEEVRLNKEIPVKLEDKNGR